VVFDGRDISRLPAQTIVRLGVAHVPEGRRLFAGLTVEENLRIGAYHRRDGEVSRDLEWVLTLFPRLRDRLRQVSGSMSGGEQRMCAIARGLMSRPRLIMIDELSLGLAPRLVEDLLGRLQEVGTNDRSILLVEQDVDAALRVAARGYVMETGEIVAEGPAGELLDDPRIREAYLGVA
jgi:branched-chain amino acid transport system ATP-binding protein